MQITVSNKSPSPFPKLQTSPNGNIFLMIDPSTGTCVYNKTLAHGVGIQYTELPSEHLTDFKQTLILEN